MKLKNYDKWSKRTAKENGKHKLKRGDEVVDFFGHKGIVVELVKGNDSEDHGTVAVWQSERYEYGMDNCEHYPEFKWQGILKVIS